MALPTGQPAAGMQDGNLKSLLDAIDRKTAPALQQDLERLHSRAERSADRVLHISFVVGWHEMALPVAAMQGLGAMPVITPLPYLPPWIRGIVQIRSEIFSVVDFQRLFQLRKERRNLHKLSFIQFQHEDLEFCLLVNRITGILNLDEEMERLAPCSPDEQAECAKMMPFIRGVLVRDQRRIFLLDSNALGHADIIRKWR